MDVDSMVASSSLDAMIAERVMGWECDAEGYYVAGPERQNTGWGDVALEAWVDGDGVLNPACREFRPSTDIAAAWQVVETVAARGYDYDVGSAPVRGHYAAFRPNLALCYRAMADTAPEAICRASLMALDGIGGTEQ